MNSEKSTQPFLDFLKKVALDPPIVFPMVALFHIVAFVLSVVTLFSSPFGIITALQVLWYVGYLSFWIGVCLLRKWGAFGYIGVSVVGIIVKYSLTNALDVGKYGSPLFIIDLVFCFFILFYFKRLR